MAKDIEEVMDTITSLVSSAVLLYIVSRLISMVTAYAYPTAPSPSPAPSPAPTPTPTPTPPPPYTPSITISASKSSLSEDPNDSVTVTVCWSNYTSPPARGDYYHVRVSSDTEGCLFDFVLIPKHAWNPTSCGNFTRRFLDVVEGGAPFFPCLGVLRGCIDNNCSQSTATVNRVPRYSINDVSGLEYDPNAGDVYLVFTKDVTNMAIIVFAWTEDDRGVGCRHLTGGTTRGFWATSSNQRFKLFTGVYPQDIQIPDTGYTCSEKYIVVRVYRPETYKEFRVAMR
jgi:hypothetical protein